MRQKKENRRVRDLNPHELTLSRRARHMPRGRGFKSHWEQIFVFFLVSTTCTFPLVPIPGRFDCF